MRSQAGRKTTRPSVRLARSSGRPRQLSLRLVLHPNPRNTPATPKNASPAGRRTVRRSAVPVRLQSFTTGTALLDRLLAAFRGRLLVPAATSGDQGEDGEKRHS